MSEDFVTKTELQKLTDTVHQSNDKKISSTLFYWVMGGMGVVLSGGIIIISGVLNYALNRIDAIDSRHQNDHDKIIKLETLIENHKKSS